MENIEIKSANNLNDKDLIKLLFDEYKKGFFDGCEYSLEIFESKNSDIFWTIQDKIAILKEAKK